MGRYETLLINLLHSIDQKLGDLRDLLEVGQNTENRGNDCADTDQGGPENNIPNQGEAPRPQEPLP